MTRTTSLTRTNALRDLPVGTKIMLVLGGMALMMIVIATISILRLTALDAERVPQPNLAAAAPVAAPDGLSWTVPLRPGVTFHDGSAFDAAVVPAVILLVGLWLGTPGSVAGAGLSGRGRPGLRTVSLLVALVFNVTFLLVLTPVLGAEGAAIATLIGAVIAGFTYQALLGNPSAEGDLAPAMEG